MRSHFGRVYIWLILSRFTYSMFPGRNTLQWVESRDSCPLFTPNSTESILALKLVQYTTLICLFSVLCCGGGTQIFSILVQGGTIIFVRFLNTQEGSGLTSGRPLLIKADGHISSYMSLCSYYTLFSKRSAHENDPNFLRSLGHRPRPLVILILVIGLEQGWFTPRDIELCP